MSKHIVNNTFANGGKLRQFGLMAVTGSECGVSFEVPINDYEELAPIAAAAVDTFVGFDTFKVHSDFPTTELRENLVKMLPGARVGLDKMKVEFGAPTLYAHGKLLPRATVEVSPTFALFGFYALALIEKENQGAPQSIAAVQASEGEPLQSDEDVSKALRKAADFALAVWDGSHGDWTGDLDEAQRLAPVLALALDGLNDAIAEFQAGVRETMERSLDTAIGMEALLASKIK